MGKSAFEGEKMKNCMNKVIKKYIIENRAKRLGNHSNFINNEKIKKTNEKYIFTLNNSIKNISYKFYKAQLEFKNS